MPEICDFYINISLKLFYNMPPYLRCTHLTEKKSVCYMPRDLRFFSFHRKLVCNMARDRCETYLFYWMFTTFSCGLVILLLFTLKKIVQESLKYFSHNLRNNLHICVKYNCRNIRVVQIINRTKWYLPQIKQIKLNIINSFNYRRYHF